MSKAKTYKLDEWREEAAKLFGPDPKNWKYKCCNCGHEQTINDFIKAGVKEPENKVFFSCIGRWTGGEGTIGNKKSPCNYTLGGLFKLSNTSVIDADGNRHWVFDFAAAEKQTEPSNASVTPIAMLLLLILLFASCSPSRYLECPRDVTETGDTIREQMLVTLRPMGFAISRYGMAIVRDDTCRAHLYCDGRQIKSPVKVWLCETERKRRAK